MTVASAQKVLLDVFSPSSLKLAQLVQQSGSGVSAGSKDMTAKIESAKVLVAGFDGFYHEKAAAPVLLEAFRAALVDNCMKEQQSGLSPLLLASSTLSTLRRHRDTQRYLVSF